MLSGLVLVLGLTATAAWGQTPARPRLDRLVIYDHLLMFTHVETRQLPTQVGK
jgi:hypothetical protein